MAATASGLLRYAGAQSKARTGIKLGISFTDRPNENDLAMLRYAGVDAVSIWTSIENNSAEWMIGMRKKLEANDVQIYNIGMIDLHCDPTITLGLPGVENKIEQYKTYLNNLGRAGIHYTTYAHMANIKNQPTPGFYQTSVGKRAETPTRANSTSAWPRPCRVRSTKSIRKSRSGNPSRHSFAP